MDTVSDIIVDDRLGSLVLRRLTLDGLGVGSVTSVATVDGSLETGTLARVRLHDLLVLAEGLVQLLGGDIVQEDTLAQWTGDCSTEFAVTSLENILATAVDYSDGMLTLRIALVAWSRTSSLKSGWSMERPTREKRFRSLLCSSSLRRPLMLARVAEYAISMEMA